MIRSLAFRALLWLRRQRDLWNLFHDDVDAEDFHYAMLAYHARMEKEPVRARYEWNWRDHRGVVHAAYVAPHFVWVNTAKLGCNESGVAIYRNRCTKDNVTCLLCLSFLQS